MYICWCLVLFLKKVRVLCCGARGNGVVCVSRERERERDCVCVGGVRGWNMDGDVLIDVNNVIRWWWWSRGV